VAQEGEADEPRVYARGGVSDADDPGVTADFFLLGAPAGVRGHDAARDPEAEEYLRHGVPPRGAVRDGVPLPLPQVKREPLPGAAQRGALDEQHEEQHVGQRHGDPDGFTRGLDAVEDARVAHQPVEAEAEDEPPLARPQPAGEGRGGEGCTKAVAADDGSLSGGDVGGGLPKEVAVEEARGAAVAPRQHLVHGTQEEHPHPGHDGAVVGREEERPERGGDANAPRARVEHRQRIHRAPLQHLAQHQLHAQNRDAEL
jgi:hypothetical protein